MQYRESLPPDCPPPSAQDITEQTVRYRLLKTTTPEQDDFDSYVREHRGANPEIPANKTACPCGHLWKPREA